ncbi:MAG: restriction endonuclease subunit S [Flavobacteriaceae bacterium]|nr:restriction endonuclease subunit S [Flavobacteriaceae bacterium]
MKRYDTYKDSGIEWIGEIPEHWKVKKLKYVSNVQTGRTPKIQGSKIDFFMNGEINWYTPADFNGNEPLVNSKRRIITNAVESNQVELFPKNSIYLVSIGATLGKVSISKSEASANQQINIISFENNSMNSFFGYYFLVGNKEMIIYEADYTTLPILNQTKLKNLLIYVPSINEQTAIANYLDQKTTEIDQLISQKETLLNLYEKEKTAIINQAVTKGINPNVKLKDSGVEWLGDIPVHWEVKRFKYFFNLMTQKSDEIFKKIGLENIISKTGKFIDKNSDFEGQGVHFKKKDVLFGKLRPYLAKVWLANFEGHAVGDFYVFRTTSDVIPEFAKYRILDYSFIDVTNSSTYGSKMPRVSWEFIANLFIAFPKPEEQTQIVKHIETEITKINTKVSNTKKLIALLKEYKTALISEVVTGKIKVN